MYAAGRMPTIPGSPTVEAVSDAVKAWASKTFSKEQVKASLDYCIKEKIADAETAVCKAISTSIDSNIRASLAAATGGTSIVFNAGTKTATQLTSFAGITKGGSTDAVKEIDRCIMAEIPIPGKPTGTCAKKAGLTGGCAIKKLRL